jgi:hypothetical protein
VIDLAFITGSVARAGAGERWSTPKDRLNISSEGARAIVKPIFYSSYGSRRHKSLILLCTRWHFRESVVPRLY